MSIPRPFSASASQQHDELGSEADFSLGRPFPLWDRLVLLAREDQGARQGLANPLGLVRQTDRLVPRCQGRLCHPLVPEVQEALAGLQNSHQVPSTQEPQLLSLCACQLFLPVYELTNARPIAVTLSSDGINRPAWSWKCRLEPYGSVGILGADAITSATGKRHGRQHHMSLPKTGSLLEFARGSIIACCSLWGACDAAIAQQRQAEERQAPANYKELIHSAVKTSFADPSSVGLVEISPLHPTRGPQLGDWMACLRIAIHGQPTFYAAFIDGEPPKVVLLRMAVRFDDCARDQYEPLPAAPSAQDRPASPPRRK